jgi:hypothetical protein
MNNDQKKEFKIPHVEPSRYRDFTPAQKWAEVVKLREMAWELKRAMIRQSHPDWSDKQVEDAVRKIFLYAVT